jgi:general secretion pathway protein K
VSRISRAGPAREVLRRNRGFALLIVLWTLVLIAFLVLHLTESGRTEIRIADNLVDNAVAAAAADGAISEAIFNQSNPNPDQRWPLDGTDHSLTIGDSRVVVQLEDEASRINPNLASPALMEGLLRAVGKDPDSARRLAAAIADWVGSAPTPRPQQALFADYRAAGLDYGPPAAPLETLDELGRVLGVTPALLAALRPHLTLFGPAEPNRAGADPVIAAALATIPQLGQAATPVSATAADLLTVRISAAALGPGNARVTRVAIVRVGSSLPSGYTVLRWGSSIN